MEENPNILQQAANCPCRSPAQGSQRASSKYTHALLTKLSNLIVKKYSKDLGLEKTLFLTEKLQSAIKNLRFSFALH